MTGKTHKIGGICAGAIVLEAMGQPLLSAAGALMVTGAMIGSLIPDIDNPHSSISCRFRVVSALYTLGQGMIWLLSYIFPQKCGEYIRGLIGHRGITHSLMLPVILTVINYTSGISVGSAVSVLIEGILAGILSHIVLDMFSGGVPLLLPLSRRRVTLAKLRTGGVGEWVVRVGLMIGLSILLMRMV